VTFYKEALYTDFALAVFNGQKPVEIVSPWFSPVL